ncbi:MAG TPA: hypothetical protein VKY39_05985 [Aggregatilineales bacterium]|nr:hypothetical protein [Aggregatilineales bacterium]
MDLGLKRVLLVVLSIAGGVAGVFLVLGFLNLAYGANVNLERYGMTFAVLTAVPVALLVAVWLDYFMGTGILKE